MNILVTGGAGFIGSNLCIKLLNAGHRVIAVDNFITSSGENIKPLIKQAKFRFYKMDINSPEFVRFFSAPENKVDQIFHLACPTGVKNLIRLAEEMLETCSRGTKNVLQIARLQRAPSLVTSTAEIYGDPEVFPQNEDYNGNVSTTGDRSAYEEGKRFSEALVAAYARKHNLNVKIARIFNSYGPGMVLNDSRVHPTFISQSILGRPLSINGDGEQTRTFCYIDDTLSGILLVMEKGRPGGVYNIGSDQQVSILKLAKMIINLTGSKSEIEFTAHKIVDHRGRLPALDRVKALGWQRTVSLEEGTKRMIRYIVRKKIGELHNLLNS